MNGAQMAVSGPMNNAGSTANAKALSSQQSQIEHEIGLLDSELSRLEDRMVKLNNRLFWCTGRGQGLPPAMDTAGNVPIAQSLLGQLEAKRFRVSEVAGSIERLLDDLHV